MVGFSEKEALMLSVRGMNGLPEKAAVASRADTHCKGIVMSEFFGLSGVRCGCQVSLA